MAPPDPSLIIEDPSQPGATDSPTPTGGYRTSSQEYTLQSVHSSTTAALSNASATRLPPK